MAVTEQYVLHGINAPGGFISQISQLGNNSQIQVVRGTPAGLPGARFIYNNGQNPDFTFAVEQVGTVLGITGCGLADMTSAATDLYLRAVPNKGQRTAAASTVHQRRRARNAVMVPLSLSASSGGNASLQARLICMYDGTNEPLVPAGSVALAGTPVAADEQYTIGPCALNGTTFAGVQEITVDFGVKLFELTSDGELYLTQVAEQERQPSVTLKVLTSALPTIGLNGAALTSMAVYFRKCAQTGRVANGTASHLKFTATSGYIHIPEETGGGNDPAITTIRAELSMPDATTQPLIYAAAAIT